MRTFLQIRGICWKGDRKNTNNKFTRIIISFNDEPTDWRNGFINCHL